MEIVAQIIGIFAMVFNVLSYQQKQQKHVIAFQLIGSALFTVHFFMLKAYMGGLLNAVGIVRAIVFIKKDFFKSENILWLIGFEVIYALSYLATFTLLGTNFTFASAVKEILPLVGMTATTVAFRSKSAKTTRLLGLISSPSWLIYNVVSLSIGAVCCEVFSLISIFIGIFRLDRTAKNVEVNAGGAKIIENSKIENCGENVETLESENCGEKIKELASENGVKKEQE